MVETTCRALKVFQQTPRRVLRPFVQRFLVVEFPAVHRDLHLPDIGPVATFSFRGACHLAGGHRVPPAAFTGLHETIRAHEHRGGHAVLLVTFTPVGAAAWVRPPLEELSGTTRDLGTVLSRSDELDRLNDQVAAAPNHGQRVSRVEDFLLARLRDSAPDPLVTAAASWLEAGTHSRRIADLTRHIGLSQSALERRFRRVVGVSPKKYASLVRLKHAVRLRAGGAGFAELAQTAGYFDQSHFINHFRRVTGCAPEEFFQRAPAG